MTNSNEPYDAAAVHNALRDLEAGPAPPPTQSYIAPEPPGRKARVEEALRAVEAGQAPPQASYVQTCSCGTTVVLTCPIHGEPVPTETTTAPPPFAGNARGCPDCGVREGLLHLEGCAQIQHALAEPFTPKLLQYDIPALIAANADALQALSLQVEHIQALMDKCAVTWCNVQDAYCAEVARREHEGRERLLADVRAEGEAAL